MNYANGAALQLWSRCWDEMIGMPSRLTAPKREQTQRQAALSRVMQQDAIKNYQGIRIDSTGQEFLVRNVRVWTLWNEDGLSFGQAAAIKEWWTL